MGGIAELHCIGINLVKDRCSVQNGPREFKGSAVRQRSYADTRRRELSFKVGDYVYLKVSPIRGTKRFGVKGKLTPRYIGPYQIQARRGEVAYQLSLPENL
jgi:hypothetical protein